MNYIDLTTYFENLAKQFADLKHTETAPRFFGIDIQELIIGTRGFANYPCMLLDISEGRYNGDSWDSMIKNRMCGLSFLNTCKPDDFAARKQIINDMEMMCEEFFSKIKQDHENQLTTGIQHLDFSNVVDYKVGPVFDNLYGYRMEIPVGHRPNNVRSFNSAKWL